MKVNTDNFNNLMKQFLQLNPSQELTSKRSIECEVKFGTKGIKSVTKNDFNNVVNKLMDMGFKTANKAGKNILKINPEYKDPNTGFTKQSNIRIEINSIYSIQSYCKTNNLTNITDRLINFTKKTSVKNSDGEFINSFNNDDFNFRVTLKNEMVLNKRNNEIKLILDDWTNLKKNFRYMNRVTFTHPDYPVKVDMSVVKTNKNISGKNNMTYTIESAGVIDNEEFYEIEIEVDNTKIGSGTQWITDNYIIFTNMLRQVIKYILSGLQQTNYPISYPIQKSILNQYMMLINKDSLVESIKITPKNFIGPSSTTLQLANLNNSDSDNNIISVRKNYTVTDKADGARKLLFIGDNGHIYLIDTNMNVQFTGSITTNDKIFNSLLDGEHIIHNKNGDFINLYAAFDIYFINKKDVRNKKFIKDESDTTKTDYRLPLLIDFIKYMKATSVNPQLSSPMRFSCKNFHNITETQNVFACCNAILSKVNEGGYIYNTDGLIFTPSYFGVGGSESTSVGPNFKHTWEHSFKWKPPEYNTIDFLVTTKKNISGEEFVGNIFEEGTDTGSTSQLTQYKTIILRCGFDERKHGYLNPCQDVIDDNLPSMNDKSTESYKPMAFYPTNPYDDTASVCNILVKSDESDTLNMMTVDGETFEDNTIVEFKYDATKPKHWRWIPIRVRYDKTNELKQGYKNYGNAYHVANSNWHSIHNPITLEMITTGTNIPDSLLNDDIYYNSSGLRSQSETRSLRDFHNLYVKNILIKSVSQYGNTLIDFAVGKGGDWPKWIKSKLSFVFGLDISKDNIENRLDGACARFLNYKKKYKIMPNSLFIHGNSSVNIRSGTASFTEKGKQIINAVFGEGPRDKELLGEGVYKQYGKAKEGFNISSCQFAFHYFLESETTLHNFLRNVSECTTIGGYFIGTCYDGKKLFNALQSKKEGESLTIVKNGKKIWEVTKEYNHSKFNDDVTCIGYAINVYQESINKVFREWLVNFDYIVRIFENYGFVLAPSQDLVRFNLNNATGMFNDLYKKMEMHVKKDPSSKMEYGDALNMSSDEKIISFYNRYFIFKKVRNVNADILSMSALNETYKEKFDMEKESNEASLAIKSEKQKLKKKKGLFELKTNIENVDKIDDESSKKPRQEKQSESVATSSISVSKPKHSKKKAKLQLTQNQLDAIETIKSDTK